MLQLYNRNKEKIEALRDYKDLSIESVLQTGDKTLSFSFPSKLSQKIEEEGYIRTIDDEFVIKEINNNGEWVNIKAILNVESLEGQAFESFNTVNKTIEETLRLAIAGTGWDVSTSTISKRRTIKKSNSSSWDIIKEIIKTYRVELEFDSINKVINIFERRGNRKGTYFINSLNLKELEIQGNSYDFYTRIIAIGKYDETNNKERKVILENFQYSKKVKTLIWKDERYTDLESLEEDALLKLEEISKPYRAYNSSVFDLANINDIYKDILSYNLGDVVTLISTEQGVKEEQRITKLVEYPEEPHRNTCELSNVALKFEDIQKEQQETTETVNNITSDNGTISEGAVRDVVRNLVVDKVDVGSLNAVEGKIGQLEATRVTTTAFEAEKAKIMELKANKAEVTDLNAANAKINTLEAGTAEINNLLAGNVSAETGQLIHLTGKNVVIDDATIKDAMIDNISASRINTGEINTNNVSIKSKDGSIEIVGNTQQWKDKNNKVRMIAGQDAKGNFLFGVFDETGVGTLYDATGVKEKALADGIIKDRMINNGEISGGKININSLIEEINKDTNTKTIKGTKVYLDTQGQTLEVGFKALKNKNDEEIKALNTKLQVEQGKIETAINNTLISKNGKDVLLKDEYSRTEQTVLSNLSKIGDLTTKTTELGKNVSSHTSEINQMKDSISLKINKSEVEENYTNKQDFENLSIGGINLFNLTDYKGKNADEIFTGKANGWYKSSAFISEIIKYTPSEKLLLDSFINNEEILKLSYIVSNESKQCFICPYGEKKEIYLTLKPNTTYTLSGYVYTGNEGTGSTYFSIYDLDDKGDNTTKVRRNTFYLPKFSGNFEKFEISFTTTERKNNQIVFYVTSKPIAESEGKEAFAYLYKFKLEEGNKATDWSPSKKDIEVAMDKKVIDAKAELKITTDSITSRIQEVETIQKEGGVNLLPNSNWANGVTEGWRITGSPTGQYMSGSKTHEDKSTITLGVKGDVEDKLIYVDSPKIFVVPGQSLTLSAIGATCESSNAEVKAYLYFTNNAEDIIKDNSFTAGGNFIEFTEVPFRKKYISDTVPTGVSRCFIRLEIKAKNEKDKKNKIGYFSSIMLANGTKPLRWTPCQQDGYLYTNKKSAEINQSLDSIKLSVSNDYLSKKDALATYSTKGDLDLTSKNLTAKFSSSGGGNMLKNSAFKNDIQYWKGYSTNDRVEIWSDSNSNKYGRLIKTTSFTPTETSKGTSLGLATKERYLNLMKEKIYTLSFKFKNVEGVDVSKMTYNYILDTNSEGKPDNKGISFLKGYTFKKEDLGDEMFRIVITFQPDRDYQNAGLLIGAYINNTVANKTGFLIGDIMLQEGSICTPWASHSSEIYEGITKIDGDGIRCDFEDGTYTMLGRDGFVWKSTEHAFPYHSLFHYEIANVVSNSFLNAGDGWYRWIVQLPDYFKGKIYTPIALIQGYYSNEALSYSSMTVGIDWKNVIYGEGKVGVMCKSINTSGSTKDYNINVILFVIA